ncbi:hypothetical protein SCH4B_4244 [Ruegeria sp. TrichCH4B]|nr:hypothetical protein SCH4B_4244 [Ruegeria sp. TrichCH4B]
MMRRVDIFPAVYRRFRWFLPVYALISQSEDTGALASAKLRATS